MKKHLLSFWAASLVLLAFASAVSCSDDPELDSEGRVQIISDPLTVDGGGEVVKISLASNAYWNLSFTDNEGAVVRWITADVVNGQGDAVVTLTVARNKSTQPRTANIVVATDDESHSATLLLRQSPGGGGGGEGYAFPMGEMFAIDVNNALSNGFIEGNACYMDNGLVIKRLGDGDAELTFVCPSHTDKNTYQRALQAGNWSAGCAWQLQIPLKEALSGDLRMGFGSRRDNSTTTCPWKFEWSSNGTEWVEFDKSLVAGGSEALWKFIGFTIPAAKAISAGGTLWVRMTPTKPEDITGNTANPGTLLFQHGVTIFPASAPVSMVVAQDKATVVFSHGFDELKDDDSSLPIAPPMGYFNTCHGGAYSQPVAHAGIVATTLAYIRPGHIQIGSGTKPGEYKITMKRFGEMNIAKCDLAVKFKAAGFLGVAAPSAGEVCVTADAASGATVDNEGKVGALETDSFKEVTVMVRNAMPETVLTITNTTAEPRFFIDDVVVTVSGTPERPNASDPTKVLISDIRAKQGSGSVTINDNNYIMGRVVSMANLPANTFAMTDGLKGILVAGTGHGLAAGDQAKVVVKGATLAPDANGLLVLTVSKAADITKTTAAAETPVAKAISVVELKSGTYEGMYVSLPASQVVDADLAKTMSGSVTLELADKTTTYTMKTLATASFASQAVPRKSGVVNGIAGKNCLMPSAMADLSAMTLPRFGTGVYAITPISEFFLADPSKLATPEDAVIGCTYNAGTKTATFTSGNTIQLVGGEEGSCSVTMLDDKRINGRFVTSGWGGDQWAKTALVVKLKATSVLKGKLRFGFGLMAPKKTTPGTWDVQWSSDNVNWNKGSVVAKTPYSESDFDATFDLSSSSPFKMARFTIPDAKAIPVGGYIYLRIAPTNNVSIDGGTVSGVEVVNFAHGVYLSTDELRAYNTSELPSGANVVLAEGFDDLIHGHDYFLPARHFLSNVHLTYAGSNGWSATGTTECPGYAMVGAASSKAGSVTSPALTALGDTPTNITVSFKVGFFLPANYTAEPKTMAVSVEGDGNVSSGALDFSAIPAIAGATISQMKATDAAYFKWYSYSVKVTGATKNTKLAFKANGRHFLDDVVVTKD